MTPRDLQRSIPRGRSGAVGPPPLPVWSDDVFLSFADGNGDPLGPAPKNLLGPEGPAGDFQNFETLTRAKASVISVIIPRIRVARYADNYPLAFADYVVGTSTGPGAFQDLAGNWRQLDISGGVVDTAWLGAATGVPDSINNAAIQAAIDMLPAGGGGIRVRGLLGITSLSLAGKKNIKFIGDGRIYGPDASFLTFLTTAVGAIGAGVPVIDCYGATNVTFEGIGFYQSNAAFNGIMIRCGNAPPVTGTGNVCFKKCSIGGVSASATLLWLYGVVGGAIDDCLIAGSGIPVQLQNAAGVGFANVIRFTRTSFQPTGNVFPVQGSAEVISFYNCFWEPGPDRRGRAFTGSTLQRIRSISFFCCGFYDPGAGGFEWIVIPWANAVSLRNCLMAGSTAGGNSYGITLGSGAHPSDPELSGVRGFSISDNDFDGLTAAINFNGDVSPGVKTGARGGYVGGNSVTSGFLFASLASCAQMTVLPNSIYETTDEFGSFFGVHSVPTAQGSMTTGSVYSNSGTLKIVT